MLHNLLLRLSGPLRLQLVAPRIYGTLTRYRTFGQLYLEGEPKVASVRLAILTLVRVALWASASLQHKSPIDRNRQSLVVPALLAIIMLIFYK